MLSQKDLICLNTVEVGLTVLAVDSVVNEYEMVSGPRLVTDLYPYPTAVPRVVYWVFKKRFSLSLTYIEVSPLFTYLSTTPLGFCPFHKLYILRNMVKAPDSPNCSPPLPPIPLSAGDAPLDQTQSRPLGYFLPDLVGHCSFPLTYNTHGDEVARESDKWLDNGCPELTPKKRKALYGLHAGELTAFCYTSCDAHRLRVISDFMNYLFHLDNISDGMMTREADKLSDVVMNALWFPEEYRPGKGQPAEEISAGKLAREYVSIRMFLLMMHIVIDVFCFSMYLVIGLVALPIQALDVRRVSKKIYNYSSKLFISRPRIVSLVRSLILNRISMFVVTRADASLYST